MPDSISRTPEPEAKSRNLLRPVVLLFCVAAALALAAALECHLYVSRQRPAIAFLPSLLYGLVLWFWWLPVAFALWRLGQRHAAILRLSAKSLALQAPAALLLSAVHLKILTATVRLLVRLWPELWSAGYDTLQFMTIERASLEILIYALLWAACAAVAQQVSAQRAALAASALREQLAAAQLHALQVQLEPHFLFNTLNAINALVDLRRNQEASLMLGHLETLLRSGLQRSAPEKIPLTDELHLVESYLAIQKVRFRERLQVDMEISPEALAGLVPCYILQPIVENAIQHGIAPARAGGTIRASARCVGRELCIEVENNGELPDPARRGFGIGLQNTQNRLTLFYADRHRFTAHALPAGGFRVAIAIPFEESEP